MPKHIFVFNIVGMSPDYLNRLAELPAVASLLKNGRKAAMNPVFPCLTLPAQASITTGTNPCDHGIVANGFYYRDRNEISFWDQYRSLVQGAPVWERIKARRPDHTTAVLFWQNMLYGNADYIVTPKPLHADHKLIQWCYSKPVGFYENLAETISPFELMHYWGPWAGPDASRWIMKATISVLQNQTPDLMLVYLPHLDYSCQRLGPEDPAIDAEIRIVDELLADFLNALDQKGIADQSALMLLSEYSLSQVDGAICPNRLLREAGFLNTRSIDGKSYIDFELSRAFAMVDHQVAHIYIRHPDDVVPVANLLQSVDGVASVLSPAQQEQMHVRHKRSGELIAVSKPSKWFAYYWWENPSEAPDFADKIDIHRKPGYDPLELFFDEEKMGIPQDVQLIHGSHGAPPENGERMASFLLSGPGTEKISMPDVMHMTHIAGIIETLALKGA